jgi:SAM-dependent methyltransferase
VPRLSAVAWQEGAREYADAAPQIGFYRETSRRLAELSGAGPGDVTVDLACGSSGLVARALLARGVAPGDLFLVDAAPEMVVEAERRLAMPEIRFLVGRAENLEVVFARLSDGPVDRILANSAFLLFELDQALEGIRRALAPNGTLTVSMAEWHLDLPGLPEHPRYRAIDARLAASGLPPKPARGSATKMRLAEVEHRLASVGLRVEAVEELDVPTRAEEWALFYGIPSVAALSMPHVPLIQATAILKDAMADLRGESLRPIRWVLYQTRSTG